jgi:hypothetical protein
MIRILLSRLASFAPRDEKMTLGHWLRGAALGVALYVLMLAALFFIFSQQETSFIYVGF